MSSTHQSSQKLLKAEVSIVADALVKKRLCRCPCCGFERSPAADDLSHRLHRQVVVWTCSSCGFMRLFDWERLTE